MSLPPAILSGLLGGLDLSDALGGLLSFPCARCLAENVVTGDPGDQPEPAPAVTLAGGSLLCADHVVTELRAQTVRDPHGDLLGDGLGLLAESHDAERRTFVKCDDPITPHPAHEHSTIRDGRRIVATCLGFTFHPETAAGA